MALLKHHGLVGDDAARVPSRACLLCSAPIDAASATLCAAELKNHRSLPSSHMVGSATSTADPPSH
eukprot:3531371-Prymnesium_polylepis.1